MAMTVVIVGMGPAGVRTAEALRLHGYNSEICIVSEEDLPPYDRPPLSKGVLSGELSIDEVALLEPTFYDEHRVQRRTGVRVTGIERAEKRIVLSDGETMAYDKLVLATGMRPRRLRGFDLGDRLFHLRSFDDAVQLRSALVPGRRVLIVGGGLLGLEIASTASSKGCEVFVAEREEALLCRSVAATVGEFLARLHRSHGVTIATDTTPLEYARVGDDGPVTALLRNGSRVEADIVVCAMGAIPNTELAEACGLEVQDGVIVNEYGQSSDPDIYAVGDISRHYNPLLNRVIRVESWHNASRQSLTVAKGIVGNPVPYAEVPWFWSDQYDVNLQIIGYPSEWDTVAVRGTRALDGPRFTVLYLQNQVVVGANTINNGRDIRIARQLIVDRSRVDPEKIGDESVPLKDAAV